MKIKTGAFISQDFGFYHWPNVRNGTADPDIEFEGKWTGKYWNCRADGYGTTNEYGNGSIFVFDFNEINPNMIIGEMPGWLDNHDFGYFFHRGCGYGYGVSCGNCFGSGSGDTNSTVFGNGYSDGRFGDSDDWDDSNGYGYGTCYGDSDYDGAGYGDAEYDPEE